MPTNRRVDRWLGGCIVVGITSFIATVAYALWWLSWVIHWG